MPWEAVEFEMSRYTEYCRGLILGNRQYKPNWMVSFTLWRWALAQQPRKTRTLIWPTSVLRACRWCWSLRPVITCTLCFHISAFFSSNNSRLFVFSSCHWPPWSCSACVLGERSYVRTTQMRSRAGQRDQKSHTRLPCEGRKAHYICCSCCLSLKCLLCGRIGC